MASDISATRGMKCLFILMSCFAWQVIILLFGWWWRITFLKPITWIVRQLTTSLWQNTWCMRWIELFICFIHFLVWFEHHDWAYQQYEISPVLLWPWLPLAVAMSVTFSLFLARLTRMIIYGYLAQIFLRDVFFLPHKKERKGRNWDLVIIAKLMLAFSPVWSLFVPVVKQNLAKQNNNVRND